MQYGRDTKGRVNLVQTKASSSVTGWTSIASGITYEPFAAVKAMVLGNTLSVANDWGNDGRLAARRLYRTSGGAGVSSLAYSYDDNDNLAAIVDVANENNSVYYGYDQNDRLSLTTLTAGAPATGTDTYGYTTGTNRLASIANTGGTRTLGYDARGNLASESRPGSIAATATYDGYARLTGYARTDTGTLSFVYNGRDDRVASTTGAGTRRFVYDADGRVLGEYGASTADVKAEFVWALPQVANDGMPFGGDDGAGGTMPLAVATPDGTGTIVLNWVHGNHLGVPIVTTDASGNPATTPNDYLAPGFPGQSRTIADLYYNRYRDYDPTTGRYIQADPIGLGGGQNSYAYAGNNPIADIDPLGLMGHGAGPKPPKPPNAVDCFKLPPPPDYCGGSDWTRITPDRIFFVSIADACKKHDDCYSRWSLTDRKVCDGNLGRDIISDCMNHFLLASPLCFIAGPAYWRAVRYAGDRFYQGRGDPR